MGNVNREMGTLKTYQKEMLKHKTKQNTNWSEKKAFYDLISTLDMNEKRISELEDIGTCGNKMQENYFQNPKHPRTMGQFQKV